MSDHPDIWRSLEYPGGRVRSPEQTWGVVDALMQLPTRQRRKIAEKLSPQQPDIDHKTKRLRDRMETLKQEIKQAHELLKSKDATIEAMQTQVDSLRQESAALRGAVKQLQKETEQLRSVPASVDEWLDV